MIYDRCTILTFNEIEDWLVSQIAGELSLNENDMDIEKPFASYGLDSASTVALSGELEDLLNIKLNPTILYEYPTIEKLSKYLTDMQIK